MLVGVIQTISPTRNTSSSHAANVQDVRIAASDFALT